MRYFYYSRRLGKIYPQASLDHPSSKLEKPYNIASGVISLSKEDAGLSLFELAQKYPYTGEQK